MQKSFFIILTFFTSLCYGQISTNEILEGIELGVREKYEEAIDHFSSLQHEHPDDPAASFFLATIWQSRMMDFETNKWRDRFMHEIETTMELCKRRVHENPGNIRDRFYLGSALSYKSFQISREKKYLSGISLAIKGMKQINHVIEQDSSFYDAYIGLGSYLYWRSYLTRSFSWLPFFSDQRRKGISLIKKSLEKGVFSKWAALSNLAWIYIQEENFKEAIKCAETGLAHFPGTRTFLWPLGDAQYKNGDFEKALLTYTVLLNSVTSEVFNNHYNEIVLHLKIAQSYYNLGQWRNALVHAQLVLDISPDKEVRDRIKPKKKQAKKLINAIQQRLRE